MKGWQERWGRANKGRKAGGEGRETGSDRKGREGRQECRGRANKGRKAGREGRKAGSDGKGREGKEGRQVGRKGLRQAGG